MARRRCFEVSSLKFRFNSYQTTIGEKTIFVCDRLNTSLNKYSSNTKLKNYYTEVDKGDIVVYVQLSKKISLNTVIKIVNKMYEHTGNKLSITYVETNDLVTVNVLQ